MRLRCSESAIWKLLAFALVVSNGTTAQARELCPLPPIMEPEKAPELTNLFHAAVAKGAAESDWQVISPEHVRAERGAKAPPCRTASCAGEIAAAMQATASALTHIKSIGKNYHIQVWFFEGSKKVAQSEARCDICTLREALDATQEAVAKAGKEARIKLPPEAKKKPVVVAAPPPKPSPSPTPQKTQEPTVTKTAKTPVATDKPAASAGKSTAPTKTAATKTPVQPAGTTATKTATKTTTTTDAQPKTAGNEATKTTAAGPKAAPHSGKTKANLGVWPLWPSLVAGGFGLVGVLTGAPLIDMDGKGTNCIGDALPDGSNCRDRYKTKPAGGVLMAIGIAGVLTSGVLLYLHFTSKEKQRLGVKSVSIAPDPGGGWVLGASGIF